MNATINLAMACEELKKQLKRTNGSTATLIESKNGWEFSVVMKNDAPIKVASEPGDILLESLKQVMQLLVDASGATQETLTIPYRSSVVYVNLKRL
ncbi:MAG: hypothetical protein IKN22_01930 [Bacteroidaceae bacterium]|nr:hypothetical protein [Bacteroidaceae bacterium]MBR3733269.1 hypothetical protein [Bacteroidaceae bacterium]MBR4649608.1 hypothetical protein [Bacteroidaceae bacterium]